MADSKTRNGTGSKLVLLLVLVVLASDALAGRRILRIDFGDWSDPPCQQSGIVRDGLLVKWMGFVFSGLDDPAFLTDTYCQNTIPGSFTQASFFDEPGMAQLVGDNSDDAITGVRYSLLDRDRFVAQNDEQGGFQWAFYFFPDGTTIVALYGLVEFGALTAGSYISEPANACADGACVYRHGFEDSANVWQGDLDGFDGEYFCFAGNVYLGTWDGEASGTDPAAACAGGP